MAGWTESRFYVSIISNSLDIVTDLGSAEIGVKLKDQAYDSMHRLFIESHYLSCDGVGRPSVDESSEANGADA